MPNMLILGATSDIARATALAFARKGWDLRLAGRDMDALRRIAQDISVRTERAVDCARFDALAPAEEHAALWRSVSADTDALFCAVGLLADQEAARHDARLAEKIVATNFTGLLPMLSLAADTFEARGNGLIIAVSSVAGDRGRASNYTYGSAKAGLTAYLSGLRQRLSTSGVQVLTVLPGFVATAMTENMNLPTRLTAAPEQVAHDILRAVEKKRGVVYTRWFWRWIMVIIRAIPENIFQKMRRL